MFLYYVPGLPRTESAHKLKMLSILTLTTHFYPTFFEKIGSFLIYKMTLFLEFFLRLSTTVPLIVHFKKKKLKLITLGSNTFFSGSNVYF